MSDLTWAPWEAPRPLTEAGEVTQHSRHLDSELSPASCPTQDWRA